MASRVGLRARLKERPDRLFSGGSLEDIDPKLWSRLGDIWARWLVEVRVQGLVCLLRTRRLGKSWHVWWL